MKISIKLLALIFLTLSACKPEQLVYTQGYILGDTNDIKPLDRGEVSDVPVEVIDAAVLLATQVDKGQMKFCSGTLIEPEDGSDRLRVLTNHHCFANVSDKGKIDSNWIPVACLNTTVYMGFSFDAEESELTKLKCAEQTLRSDVDGDVAVFTLSENPPKRFKPIKIRKEQVTDVVDALILHYPDVATNYKTIPGTSVRLPVASITNTDCQTKGVFTEKEWHLDNSLPYSIKHTCDLVQGSSGSSLLDAKTFELIGVNWGGIKINYKNGSELNNVATGTDFVNAFLAGDVEGLKEKASKYRNSSDAEGVTAEVDRNKNKDKSLSGKIKDATCGHIGAAGHGSPWSSWIILLILLSPVIVVQSSRRIKIDS